MTGHAGHDHGAHSRGVSERRLGGAALLTGAFMLVEVVGGVVSGSLALLADAGHMVTDFASLALAWFGFRLARRPADWRRTFGFDRFTILAAFTNGVVLFAIAGAILLEAWRRFGDPVPVMGEVMLWVALAGLAVNVLAMVILSGGDRDNLNVRAAALHVAGDLLGSVAALVASVVIMTTGWMPVDPLLSVVVALIILRSAWAVLRESGDILLEGAPAHLDTREIALDLREFVDAVDDVHHVHAWSIVQERPMITLHARVRAPAAVDEVTAAIKARLHDRFGVDHATVEVELERCADARSGGRGAAGRRAPKSAERG
jgi:cobalt-zinc-cadmium efflux system protein